jgi:hypothetical protein
MKQSQKPGNENDTELLELSKSRQLFLLSEFTDLIKPQNNITHWEQVTCAGYNPYYRRLEAVVNIKETTGFNGNLCSKGSHEYVRFFVDFKDGFGFRNMGVTNFKVANISNNPPGPQHPLSYLTYLFINDEWHRRFLDCDHAVIPTLRAVLSWNSIPSLNPNQSPHYGNHIDANIQLARKPIIWWKDIVELGKIKDLAKLVEPEFEIKLKEPVAASAESIYKLNQAAEVPLHRTFYSSIGSKINSDLDFSKATSVLDLTNFDDFKIDFNNFYDFFNGAGKKADVDYEELTCVGLNTITSRLGAVIHIKKPNGFNGNLCTHGSNEHVAFWADWNNDGTFDQYLGTVSLNVHDIKNIPKGGLFYTVQLPMNVTDRLKECSHPNIIRVRAVLSWESLPSTINPNKLNHWGNYKDALVQLRPSVNTSVIFPVIHYVGNANREWINPANYLYCPPFATMENTDRPWGGAIKFNGIIGRGGFNGVIKYIIEYKKQGASDLTYQPVSTTEHFTLDDLSTPAGSYDDPQITVDGWYTYKENLNAGFYIDNVDGLLATWYAGSLADGNYTIRLRYTNEFGVIVDGDTFTITVCNKQMDVSPTANTVVDFGKDVDLVIDGGDCHSYTPGAPTINGHLRAVHPYFASWALELQPTSHTHGVTPVPVARTCSSIGDNGDANATWSLDTAPLDPCGYTVSLSAHSRVILNSNPGNFPYYGPKAVGFAKLP